MPLLNENYQNLEESYLFAEIARRVSKYEEAHPDQKIIRLGIGDVTKPLTKKVIEALHKAVEEQAVSETFRGYGPEKGYDFLRNAISAYYKKNGADVDPDTIFISDGAKSDTGNITDLFGKDNVVLVPDPVYPVYVDSNIMCGRSGVLNEEGKWSNVTYLPCTAENGFVPAIPDHRIDLLYLCYPNNPTGTTLTHEQLKQWVDYAIANDTLIIFDAAYEAYIQEPDVPHSIYEIRGAKKVAIEIRSFSKTAGFTGVRCGYTIVPKEVTAADINGKRIPLNPLWNRRQCTKFNGTSYITQRGAEAVYTPQGQKQVKEIIGYYMGNARLMREELTQMGFEVYGGVNAPYIWLRAPKGMSSWKFFDKLLYEVNIVSTPGIGFGPSGEGYVRLTAFGKHEDCIEAMQRIRKWM